MLSKNRKREEHERRTYNPSSEARERENITSDMQKRSFPAGTRETKREVKTHQHDEMWDPTEKACQVNNVNIKKDARRMDGKHLTKRRKKVNFGSGNVAGRVGDADHVVGRGVKI